MGVTVTIDAFHEEFPNITVSVEQQLSFRHQLGPAACGGSRNTGLFYIINQVT